MEMRVDSNRIKSERETRGWSQDHLATVAGLSLRTIQRIEKTGSASYDSVTALAAVFSVAVADLRADESQPQRARAIRLSLELPMRLALAVVSGILCALYFRWSLDGWLAYGWLDFVIPGALFGASVLCPYLAAGSGLMPRALALIAASALSYFCAVMTALNADAWFSVAPAFSAYVLAGLVGVTIVLVAVRIVIPLRVTAAFWLLGSVAGALGGAAMYAGFEVLGDSTWSTIAGFCVWHVLTGIAIYRGHRTDDAASGLLAAFARARGRFSIVPGWMRLSHAIRLRADACLSSRVSTNFTD